MGAWCNEAWDGTSVTVRQTKTDYCRAEWERSWCFFLLVGQRGLVRNPDPRNRPHAQSQPVCPECRPLSFDSGLTMLAQHAQRPCVCLAPIPGTYLLA